MAVHGAGRARIGGERWTIERVKEYIRMAAEAERLMQRPRLPAGFKTCLPNPVRRRATDYPDEVPIMSPPKPVPEQFTVYDQVMVDAPWHTWVTRREWSVIWLWAQDRMGWKSIARQLNMDRQSVLRSFRAGVSRIVDGLNK